MIVKKRIEIICMTLIVLFLFAGNAFAEGEWTTNIAGDIYNTNQGGNVGIGTASPDSILHIDGSSQLRLSRSGDSTWRLFTTNTGSGGLAIRDETATEYRMFFSEDGSVGIGTTSPQDGLHVQDSIRTNSRIRVSTGTVVYPAITELTDTDTGISWPAKNELGFSTKGVERLRINLNGNVGIGTTDPATTLHISKPNPAIRLEESNVRTWDIALDNSPDSLQFRDRTSSKIPLTISSTGNVGIGTTSPNSALEVKQTSINEAIATFTSTYGGEHSAGIGVDGRGSNWGAALYKME